MRFIESCLIQILLVPISEFCWFSCWNRILRSILVRGWPSAGYKSIRSHRTRHQLIPPGSKAIPGGRNVREGVQLSPLSPLVCCRWPIVDRRIIKMPYLYFLCCWKIFSKLCQIRFWRIFAWFVTAGLIWSFSKLCQNRFWGIFCRFATVGLIWSFSEFCQNRFWRILPDSLLQVWL